jgi:phospholipase C
MPQQEEGIKPANALPYELYADGKLSADKKSFEIKFKAGNNVFGKQAAGSPFNVYAPGKYIGFHYPRKMEAVRTWSYALTPGDSLTDAWPVNEFDKNNYHLRVYGPNGFYREFKGNANDPLFDVGFAYQAINKKLNGKIILTFSLGITGKPLTVDIIDNSYKTGARQMNVQRESFIAQTVILDLAKSYGWYDFSIKVNGYNNFEKRYAGRVETGRDSFSDPLMGRTIV